uniref:Oncostatin-M-specific receptor subunit beta-like isoform X2 n=1 Tax=Pogona vitticeps TaxID=103695 RepID=A0ABM5FU40_9SAUR
MNHLVFQTVVLYAVLYFGQGNHVIQPRNLKVSMNLTLQQLLLEWYVSDDPKTNHCEIDIVFTIQIYRTEENNIILTENYTTALNKSNQPLNWSWISDIPLQCATHGVRLRSMVAPLEAWSNWTSWEAVDGLDVLNDSKGYIFPYEKYVEEGSSVTFCCIAKKNEHVTNYTFHKHTEIVNTTQQRIMFTETAVPLTSEMGLSVYCRFSYQSSFSDLDRTVLFVTRQPDEPRLLDCETKDMVELKCTWDPGEIYSYNDNCLTEFILSDVSHTKTYCSCTKQCRLCQFKISGEQTKYNLTLVSKNCLGQKQAYVDIDVANRVLLPPPDQLSVGYQNATMIQLYWTLKPIMKTLLVVCQVNIFSLDEEEKQYNMTVLSSPPLHPHINLHGLQVYTNYTLKVRCAAANDLFWKWSKWSQTITIQTNESAPAGQLDIWGDISPGFKERNVTVFWKASPGFQANGNIKTYEICWENVEQSGGCHSTKSNNYTISLNSQSYKITVWAKNSASASPPSVLHLSAAEDNGDVKYSEENTTGNTAHGIYVSWKPTSKFDGYVVDWCNYPRSQPCDFQWRRFGQNESSTIITSEPVQDPSFNISAVTSSSVTVSWESYPEDSQLGFIRGYNVYIKMANRNCTLKLSETLLFPGDLVACKHTIKDRNEKKLTLRNLEPGITYLLAVQAYSVNPRNMADKFEPVTTQLERNWFHRLLPPLITVPLMIIICVCFWKSDCVRNYLFPEVPHPHVSPVKKTLVVIEDHEVTPDRLVVMKKPDISIDSLLFEGRAIENATYFNPSCCQSLQDQEGASRKLSCASTSYRPLQDFVKSRPTTSCPPETGQSNLNYVSQIKVPLLGVLQGASPSFREP